MMKQVTDDLVSGSQIGILLATYCEAQNIKHLIAEIEDVQPNAQILVIARA